MKTKRLNTDKLAERILILSEAYRDLAGRFETLETERDVLRAKLEAGRGRVYASKLKRKWPRV